MSVEKISLDAQVVSNKSVVSCDLDGEAAMLNMDDGVYYGLNTVGASVWNHIQEPISVQEVVELILEEYDVEQDRCQADVVKLLEELLEKGLIEKK